MHTTLVAAVLQSHMGPDEGQWSVELVVLRHIDVCSDEILSLIRCEWFIIVGNDSIEGHIEGSFILHL